MPSLEDSVQRLRQTDRKELESLMLAASMSHATLCAAASDEPEPHAPAETMATRIREMTTEDLARALAPFASVAELVLEHHDRGHRH